MLGLGLGIKKDQGFIAGAAAGELTFRSAADTNTSGLFMIGDDENIVAALVSTDSYTINKLRNNGALGENDLAQGTFSVTLQRTSGTTGSETVDAQSTGTLYGYILSPATSSVTIVLSPNNSYSGSSIFTALLSGSHPGINATTFGSTDITTTAEDRYRIKYTYTVGSQTSSEFTHPTYPIDAA